MNTRTSANLFIEWSRLKRLETYFWNVMLVQGRSQDFSKGGSQTGTPSGDRRLYMVYTAALHRVSAGPVVLSQHEVPY